MNGKRAHKFKTSKHGSKYVNAEIHNKIRQLRNNPIISSGLRPRCARSQPRYVAKEDREKYNKKYILFESISKTSWEDLQIMPKACIWNPRHHKKDPKRSKITPKGAQGIQSETKGAPKWPQREPKGPKVSPKGAQGSPSEHKGSPKDTQGTQKVLQNNPKVTPRGPIGTSIILKVKNIKNTMVFHHNEG